MQNIQHLTQIEVGAQYLSGYLAKRKPCRLYVMDLEHRKLSHTLIVFAYVGLHFIHFDRQSKVRDLCFDAPRLIIAGYQEDITGLQVGHDD